MERYWLEVSAGDRDEYLIKAAYLIKQGYYPNEDESRLAQRIAAVAAGKIKPKLEF